MSLTAIEAYAARDSRAARLGWIYVSDDSCPRKLAGLWCRNNDEYGTCWCTSFVSLGRHLHDHGATWRDRHGRGFVLWEPYDAHGDALAELIAAAGEDGIQVRIAESVWNPPATIGIRFQAANR